MSKLSLRAAHRASPVVVLPYSPDLRCPLCGRGIQDGYVYDPDTGHVVHECWACGGWYSVQAMYRYTKAKGEITVRVVYDRIISEAQNVLNHTTRPAHRDAWMSIIAWLKARQKEELDGEGS